MIYKIIYILGFIFSGTKFSVSCSVVFIKSVAALNQLTGSTSPPLDN
jgi:hypothetical protein